MFVLCHKFQKSPFLLSCDSFPCHTVVHNNSGKLKLKRILAYQIIIDSHLESRSNNTPYRMNGTVTPSVLLQFDKPAFSVRQFHFINSLLPEILFFDDVDHKFIISFGIVAYSCFLQEIFFYQFQNGHFSSTRNNLIIKVFQYQFFFLS